MGVWKGGPRRVGVPRRVYVAGWGQIHHSPCRRRNVQLTAAVQLQQQHSYGHTTRTCLRLLSTVPLQGTYVYIRAAYSYN